ncbi:protein FAR-RED IMPAIRED RESPONSE 1-like [Carya illinoinensis]|uniref:protein FAR-RED IMPAIRED RESPONSE 1-like n=1 Tax=Carya illinoinensis TaxID=32201 RepID=UPI001C71C7CD|nr:protein FAR-RED IMPAIRED RESPONSE 1-like [Carya illinoinensis]
MDGEAPKAIITDQDRAMKNAIALVFPNTRHRYCLWHILKKVPEKLGSHHAYKTGLKTSLLKCVYDSQTIGEFENSWDVLITTYNLQENAWLHSLYDERSFWVPVFLKEIFWAGMSTTQRNESMNALFDGYIHSRTYLKEFVDQFNNALRKKIENENGVDFHSFNVIIPVVSISPLEKIFQNIYTNAKFREVQKEIIEMLGVLPTLHRKDGVVATYHVEDEVVVDNFIKEVTQMVYFNEAECDPHGGETCRNLFGHVDIGTEESVHIQQSQNTTEVLEYGGTQFGFAMSIYWGRWNPAGTVVWDTAMVIRAAIVGEKWVAEYFVVVLELVKNFPSEFINFPIFIWSTKDIDVEVPVDEDESGLE